MGDTHESLLPPSTGDFTPSTPSGLTPNTRSEAEAALTHNSLTQTESAAPTTPLPSRSNMPPFAADGGGSADGGNEAQQAYHRPAGPLRTSSTNYEKALLEARKQSSVSSNLSTGTPETDSNSNITNAPNVASPPTTTTPFPPPGQGVVPLNPGISVGQTAWLEPRRPGPPAQLERAGYQALVYCGAYGAG